VQACVDNIIISDGKVDVLIANAGIGFARSTEQASEADG
jgi:NAD(P)-dependent dehydrogenase (short-subunit alcohol dehydrogenase family)